MFSLARILFLLCASFAIKSAFVSAFVFVDGAYIYPKPLPPVQFDEPPTIPPTLDHSYLPPSPPVQDEIPSLPMGPTYIPPSGYPVDTPATDILPPQFDIPEDDDSVVVSAPPNHYIPPSSQYLPPPKTSKHGTPQIKIFNMSCVDASSGIPQFRAILKSLYTPEVLPSIEGATVGCINPISIDTYLIRIEGNRMNDCGVKSCLTTKIQNKMCLTIRLATVQGLRLPEDVLVSLQCTPQQSVVSHTKHLKFNSQEIRGRSLRRNTAVASGGIQRKFDMVVNLLRKSIGSYDFDTQVTSGSAVSLGEELLLKIEVKGDGWRHSKIGSVTMQSLSSHRSVALLDEFGCRNPTMKTICPEQPKQPTALITILPFRAFLFEGPGGADEMMLSVKMQACLHPHDCLLGKHCQDRGNLKTRSKRSFNGSIESRKIDDLSKIKDLETELFFKVNLIPLDATNGEFDRTTYVFVLIFVLTFVCFILLVFVIFQRLTKH